MASPTLTPQEYQDRQNANKIVPPKKVKEVIKYISKDVPQKLSTLFESLAYLIVITLYFFFTGLALLLNRKLPPFWTDLAKHLEAGSIAEKIQEVEKSTQIKKRAGKARVVDLETNEVINL